MADEQKTVFISYRRSASRYIARSIFEHLQGHGYDVFLDVESIDAGDFERIILGQIQARAHFLIILSTGTVKRFEEKGDWLRREIEFALDLKRNVIPITVDTFKFNKRSEKYLTGKLEQLPKLNALELYHNYFNEAMARLRERYLKQPVYGEIIPIPISDHDLVARAVAQIASEPKPTQKQLNAEDYFNRAFEKYEAKDYDGAIADYDKAIELNSRFAEAYNNRGIAHGNKKNFDKAITDYDKAIELNHLDASTYNNRGAVRSKKGDYDGAIADFNKALELDPEFAEAYINRGDSYTNKDDFDRAFADFNKALELDPEFAEAYSNRGVIFYVKDDLDRAFTDFNKALELDPQLALAYNNRGVAYLTLMNFSGAKSDFNKAIKLKYDEPLVYANIAITDHALGNIDKALRLWKRLLKKDARYRDPEWVRKEQKWAAPLVEEAKKLIARL